MNKAPGVAPHLEEARFSSKSHCPAPACESHSRENTPGEPSVLPQLSEVITSVTLLDIGLRN